MEAGTKVRYLILPEARRQYGGPLSFSTRLGAYLDDNGFERHGKVDADLDVLLVFVRASWRDLIMARLKGVPIVLRLDGLYYPRKSGFWNREYLRVNLQVFFIRRLFSRFVIYQSEFSRRMCDRLIGASGKPYAIIHNSVAAPPDTGKVSADTGPTVRLVAIGNFRGMDMLPCTVKALDGLATEGSFTLDVYGKLDRISKPYLDRPWLRWRGEVSNADVIRILSSYDALLFTQLCPSCPNVIVEAKSVGLPVIAFDSGSVCELLGFNRELIAPVHRRLLHGPQDFSPPLLAECILRFLRNPARYKKESIEQSGKSGSESGFLKYRDALLGAARAKARTEERRNA